MKVRALKTIYSDGETTRRDDEVTVSAVRGRQLIAKGYAVAVGDPVVPQAANDNAESKKAVKSEGPFEERRTGGSTGEDKRASSSPEDRPRRKRRSTSQEDDAE